MNVNKFENTIEELIINWTCALWTMSSVHYKFRSSLEYDTLSFDGPSISLNDLRDAIMVQKKIGKNSDFTLEVTNAQTKEGKIVYIIKVIKDLFGSRGRCERWKLLKRQLSLSSQGFFALNRYFTKIDFSL